jgi:hypothetical protein
MVNPAYKTITYDSTAAELNLNTWYSNGPSDVNASKIILSGNLIWDIKWQIGIFAKQNLIFDGKSYSIILAKDTAGVGTSPSKFDGLLCIGSSASYNYNLADSSDYYGLHVKNLILDAETNSIILNTYKRFIGYLFGYYYNNSLQGWGAHGNTNLNSRITDSTKHTFICEKVQIKAYYDPVDYMTKLWLTFKTGWDSNYSKQASCGAICGMVYGRAKFINCMANGRLTGYNANGWMEFVNCFVSNDSLITGSSINRHGIASSHNKYIFENCVGYKLMDDLYSTPTHSDILANGGKIIEITNCKVDSSTYWATNPGTQNITETNSVVSFDYLDGNGVLKPSEIDNIISVLGNSFVKNGDNVALNFSPYSDIDIADVLAVRAIDLTSTDVVTTAAIPTTWFDDLEGTGETLERSKETRRNTLIDEIFTANTTKTFFDISKSVMNLSADSIKESTRIFKVDANTNTATVNLNTDNTLSDKKGFYVPLTLDNQKVAITSKSGDISFEIERTGVDSDGNALYQITKSGGTANLTINA